MKRTLSIFLASLLLLSSFVSCSNNDAGTNTDAEEQTADDAAAMADEVTETAEAAEELSDYELRQQIPDNLPESDFQGKTLSFVTNDDPIVCDYYAELMSDELTGEVCNDAVYQRQLNVEERFNMKMTVEQNTAPQNLPALMAKAGDAEYLVCCFKDYLSYTPITANALLNWLDVPNVDLDQPWHNKLANDDATINGYLYTICSDLSITSMIFTFSMYANLNLMDQYGYSSSDLYGFVNEGTWTIDRFCSMVEQMYVDTNGNGAYDDDDRYGFAYSIINPADVWFTAFGGRCTSKNEDGTLSLTFYSEKTEDMLNKLRALHLENPGYRITEGQYTEQEWFRSEKIVLAPLRLYAAFSALRDMESSYTILPYPKWDEAQSEYYTNADDKFTVFGLPVTSVSEMEFIGTCFEALCAESYKKVYPAYYDTALKGKYSTDAETADMIELIMAGRAFDVSFQFAQTTFQKLPWLIRIQVDEPSNTLASDYKAAEKMIKKGLDKLLKDSYHVGE